MMDVLQQADEFQASADRLLQQTPLLKMLTELGQPVRTGSSTNGLMAIQDIDFAIQTAEPDFQRAMRLVPRLFTELQACSVKLTDFSRQNGEGAYFYIGLTLPFQGQDWPVSATVGGLGTITTDPPELADWLQNVTPEQRLVILKLKHDLIEAGRYAGTQAKPPLTFRSRHVYEGVLHGNAQNVKELEAYFKQ